MYRSTPGFDQTKGTQEGGLVPTPFVVEDEYPDDISGRKSIVGGVNATLDISNKIKSTLNLFAMNTTFKGYANTWDEGPYLTDFDNSEYIASERLDFKFNKDHSAFIHGYSRRICSISWPSSA